MAHVGSSARRLAGIVRGRPTASEGRMPPDRRRGAAARRPLRRGWRPGRPDTATPDTDLLRPLGGADDEIDPAFDEYGELGHHVDGLAARLRHGLHHPGDDPWMDD